MLRISGDIFEWVASLNNVQGVTKDLGCNNECLTKKKTIFGTLH